MIMVASYCRVSTDKEDQANSFEAQQRYFREYIARQPDWELYDILWPAVKDAVRRIYDHGC